MVFGHHLPRRLKNCTARSWHSASSRVLNVPRFLCLPVFGSIFREYSRYWPDLSLRIMDSYGFTSVAVTLAG